MAAALLALSLTSPAPSQAQGAKLPSTVTVRSGDTLDAISQRWGVPLADLKRLNGLKDADLLQVGQTLRLAPAARKGAVVMVKSGDTFETIAKAHNTTAAALQKANPGIQPEKLKVGSSLRLPGAGRSAAPAKASAAPPTTLAKAPPSPPTAPAKPAAVPQTPPAKPAPAIAQAPPAKPAPATPQTLPAKPAAAVPQTPPAKPPTPSPATPASASGGAPTTPPAAGLVPETPPLRPPSPQPPPSADSPEPANRGRWRYYGDTVVDWGSWKRLPDGVRFTLVQAAAKDVGEQRAQATAIAVDCSTLRHNWRVKEAWEAWTVPAPRSVGQQIVLDLCGNTAADDRRPVPPPPSPTP